MVAEIDFPPTQSDASLPDWWPQDREAATAPVIRPLGASCLEGLTTVGERVLTLDRSWGYLLEIDPLTQVHRILNPHLAPELRDTFALSADPDGQHLWFSRDRQIFRLPLAELAQAHHLAQYQVGLAPYLIEGLSVHPEGLYATSYQREKVLHLDPTTGDLIQEFQAPGVGRQQILAQAEVLWITDRVEETLYVLDRSTGEELTRFLTAYPAPTGLTFWQDQLWIAYAMEETFIRENPNDPRPLSVSIRNKTLLSPLRIKRPERLTALHPPEPDPAPSIPACPAPYLPQLSRGRIHYTLCNGYRVELTYLEEIDQQEPQTREQVEWTIALPCTSLRQRVHSVVSVGQPFQIQQQMGQQVAVFDLGQLQAGEARLFGWKAVIDLYNIKYLLEPEDVEHAEIPMDLQFRYLQDDDALAMDAPIVQDAAQEAIGTETNILRKMLSIREFVYDRLSYRVTPRIETPDVVLRRGEGSCGEYVGLLLALARLNGIPCRTVGRYKCPPFPELKQVPLFPEYNHVWIEFYLPGWGWVPMESNPDDLGERPYPQRFFMGLPWTHAEIAKGIPFETCNVTDASIGELAINHVQFRILEEL